MFLDRKDPERRIKRRESVKKPVNVRTNKKTTVQSKYIPQRVKDKVWKKDGGRCGFVGTNGKRCNSTYNLQFDHHPIPFARGGLNNVNNLRLLCAKHNIYAAEQVYGKKHMGLFSRRE